MPLIPATIPFTVGGTSSGQTIACGIATETDTPLAATPVQLTTPGGTGYLADVTVEIAFDAGHRTPAASRTWTDVSSYVEATPGINIVRGRQDEQSKVTPGSLTLVLDNRDGRFTPGNPAGAYYPNVLMGRPIRVRAAVGGTTYDRILAYVDSWELGWPDGTEDAAAVTVTATTRMSRLGEGAEVVALLLEEISADAPAAWYQLSEPAGSNSAEDHSGNDREELTVTRSGPALEFGVEAGSPTTDGLTAVRFAGGSGRYLKARTAFGPGLSGLTLECFVSSTSGLEHMIMEVYTTEDSLTPFAYLYWSAGSIRLRALGSIGLDETITTAAVYADGAVHHVVGRITSTNMKLYVDGAEVNSTTYSTRTYGAKYVSVGDSVLREGFGEGAFDGVIAHVCIYEVALDPARIEAHAYAANLGGLGELPGPRITRYAALAGIPAEEVSAASGSAPMAQIDTTGLSIADLMGKVEDTDGGLLLDGKDGTLIYQARSHRYNTTSAFTLNGQLHQLEASTSAVLDAESVINQVDVSLSSGTYTHRAKNGASITAYGVYGATLEVTSTSRDEARQAAHVRVKRFAEPRLRAPAFDVDLTAQTSMAAILDADVGTRFTVSNAPSQAPGVAAVYVIEGYTETITGDSHRMSINASSATPYNVWKLEDATFGVFDAYPLAY